MPERAPAPDVASMRAALDALLVRANWYYSRRIDVPQVILTSLAQFAQWLGIEFRFSSRRIQVKT